ncbi:hypothetical protein Gpo141_00007176 [Globisporangium polare]
MLVTAAAILALSSSSSNRPILSITTSTQQQTPLFPVTQQQAKESGARNLLSHCEEKFITQELDHFRANGGGGTFEQRYFVCSQETFNPKNGTIFFYFGAEADVLLYLNSTGLMWENAKAFNALIVFAEHRYFGKSIPFGAEKVLDHMEFLSSSQALADDAVLIEELKNELNLKVPLIGFGGSYGGMLGTWFRTKYPHLIDGVIAASAPVLAFLGDEKHPVDSEGFLRIVTNDMSESAGSARNCVHNARRAYETFVAIGESASGRQELTKIFKLCDQNMLVDDKAVGVVANALLSVFAVLAMGNYPYPSSYMTAGKSAMPAYPVRAACEFLRPDFDADGEDDGHVALMTAFRESASVFLNSSQHETCLSPAPSNASVLASFFDYIACAELFMPMSSDGVHDVFPPTDIDLVHDDARCFATWGVHLRVDWGSTQYGGVDALRKASNIVFSNGDFDPWSATGVLESLTDSVVYLPIKGSAHHLDLFFTHPLDPPELTKARETEKQYIRQWIDEFYANEMAMLQ